MWASIRIVMAAGERQSSWATIDGKCNVIHVMTIEASAAISVQGDQVRLRDQGHQVKLSQIDVGPARSSSDPM